ncbi:uncharacterized protein EV420DRAFT_781983 [Desarmillaria tabescens]|uniref:Uncharacterized protein n=1 Tax=Armillaria tabescens TaxID=1929756 RepID=A0AA39MXP0_ARMTA|nr:uncharacterized protein EV420DRAFT_781983 [Desarmillaria tabescens]KAK0449675.1 hypothetical protein EV420DRAFT_781983 [Desarmillaria tabescens]
MKLTTILILGLASLAGAKTSPIDKRLGCPEASRFGGFDVTPSNLQPGTEFTINADFTCGVEYFGIVPRYTDFYIEVPENNNGYEPDILIARREFTLPSPPLPPVLTFTARFPYYPVFFEAAQYMIALVNTYPINGTDGSEVLIRGGVYVPINVTSYLTPGPSRK